MSYSVEWLPEAESQLTVIWLESSDQKAVTDAAIAIDRSLANDPFSIGESREENIRIGFEFPLRFLYRVYAGRSLVQVISLGLIRKR